MAPGVGVGKASGIGGGGWSVGERCDERERGGPGAAAEGGGGGAEQSGGRHGRKEGSRAKL